MSIYTDDDGTIHVSVMVGGKRAHRRLAKGATASQAKQLEAELRAVMGKHEKILGLSRDPALTEILAVYQRHAVHLRGGENKHAVLRMVPWAKKFRASQAAAFAAAFIGDARGSYATATINRSIAALKKGYSLAWEQNLIPENYGHRIKFLPDNNKREVFLNIDQVRAVAAHCTWSVKAVVWTALLTGARRGELSKLTPECVTEDTITFVSSTTKTNRTRVVPIIAALKPWIKSFPYGFNANSITLAWVRARRKAGLDHATFHDLRHSCASILLENGVDLYTIGKILGHVNVQTTQRYAHLQIEQQRAALDKLSSKVIEITPGITPAPSKPA
jgi:integrase